jgi:hypothetical protein
MVVWMVDHVEQCTTGIFKSLSQDRLEATSRNKSARIASSEDSQLVAIAVDGNAFCDRDM